MNRSDLVLAVLAASGGRPYTPIQIQKAIFVVCDHFPDLISGRKFNFEPYDYGPFDSEVYSEIYALQSAGEAVIAPSPMGQWNTYAASDAGVVRGRELLGEIGARRRDYIQEISRWVRSQSFSSLVKSIYQAYPQMRVNSIFRG
jgi:hypothetical protein